MRFYDIFIISRGTKVILSITFSVSVLAIVFAYFYYSDINKSEDPRIEKAREYLFEYEKISERYYGLEAFPFLDSAKSIFMSLSDYSSSFEIGLINNNKCSALLSVSYTHLR